jgi:hypothetical protein
MIEMFLQFIMTELSLIIDVSPAGSSKSIDHGYGLPVVTGAQEAQPRKQKKQ